jgi:HSP20 family protein
LPTVLRRRPAIPTRWPAERAFDRFLEQWFEGGKPEAAQASYPIDMDETEDKITVDAEMPGFAKEDIDVGVDQGVLNISAEREDKTAEGTRHLAERQYKRVNRSISLPTDVDEENIQASLDKGVLHLDLPKAQKRTRRRITVQ